MKQGVERWNGTAERTPFHCSSPWQWNGGTPDISALVRDLLGEPNRRASRGSDWRYGAKGSLSVDVARGVWCDHESGDGGGLVDLVQRERGGSRAEAGMWLAQCGQEAVPTGKMAAQGVILYTERKKAPESGEYWQPLWRASQRPEGSPVETYLASRGLVLPNEAARVLRYHPACPFGPDRLPAMLGLIRNAETGEAQGLHRTPLTEAGKRARGSDEKKLPKMMLGTAGGGAVMLSSDWQVETGLGVSEGIETGLAALQRRPWVPTWAALSAGGVTRFPVLHGLEAVTVYADSDVPGVEAARTLCSRYADAGRFAELVRPRADGADMADLQG